MIICATFLQLIMDGMDGMHGMYVTINFSITRAQSVAAAVIVKF